MFILTVPFITKDGLKGEVVLVATEGACIRFTITATGFVTVREILDGLLYEGSSVIVRLGEMLQPLNDPGRFERVGMCNLRTDTFTNGRD